MTFKVRHHGNASRTTWGRLAVYFLQLENLFHLSCTRIPHRILLFSCFNGVSLFYSVWKPFSWGLRSWWAKVFKHELKVFKQSVLSWEIFLCFLFLVWWYFWPFPRKFQFCLSHYLGVLRKTTKEFWKEDGVVSGRHINHSLLILIGISRCLFSFYFSKQLFCHSHQHLIFRYQLHFNVKHLLGDFLTQS